MCKPAAVIELMFNNLLTRHQTLKTGTYYSLWKINNNEKWKNLFIAIIMEEGSSPDWDIIKITIYNENQAFRTTDKPRWNVLFIIRSTCELPSFN